ncbi:MAG: DUF167 domain-containing protein [Anaerolineales bacterium]|jgi:uncharacterized protein (TIGR00251 family)|uniref:DUF167 domain-containing protein n=1 Tax=Candidatus Villigracilis affinis TaxID=3140682 RepID=UPI001E04DCCC|nr:DUF167 domain-containing protein [Anaerolineales bacterium]MBK9600624.1 DUF167 domain-containing protein [Anaerolineales bacterium]MBL0345536.1 DUF167 domain-containing protein [Anaerolineales bacterium]
MSRKYVLHSGQRGSALAVRITPRASRNQIVGVLSDGTVKVHLASEPADEVLNVELVGYLAEVLGVPRSRVEVVAGENGRDKLVSILDMDVETAHQRVLAHVD